MQKGKQYGKTEYLGVAVSNKFKSWSPGIKLNRNPVPKTTQICQGPCWDI